MTATIPTAKSWLCRAGRHHWIGVEDDNPEMRGQAYLQSAIVAANCPPLSSATPLRI